MVPELDRKTNFLDHTLSKLFRLVLCRTQAPLKLVLEKNVIDCDIELEGNGIYTQIKEDAIDVPLSEPCPRGRAQ